MDNPPPLDEAGIPIAHVLTADGAMTDEEYASRDRTDALYDGEKMVNYGPQPSAAEAEAARTESGRDAEDERAAEPDVGPTHQAHIDRSQEVIDRPGGETGSVLVLREGESDIEDFQHRREEHDSVEPGPQVYASEAEPEESEEDAEGADPEAEKAAIYHDAMARGYSDAEARDLAWPTEGQDVPPASDPPENAAEENAAEKDLAVYESPADPDKQAADSEDNENEPV